MSLTAILAGVKEGENVCRLEQSHSTTAGEFGLNPSNLININLNTGSWAGYTVCPCKASARGWEAGDMQQKPGPCLCSMEAKFLE